VSSPSSACLSVYRLTRTRSLILYLDNAGYRTLGKPSQSVHRRPVWCELVQAEQTIRYQNYPWYLNIGPLIGAVAAGCPIVIKVRPLPRNLSSFPLPG
jgi:hypothetical protein